jgi:hypothetical protein
VIRTLCPDQLLAARHQGISRSDGMTPTAKTAGVFTIATFDNNR